MGNSESGFRCGNPVWSPLNFVDGMTGQIMCFAQCPAHCRLSATGVSYDHNARHETNLCCITDFSNNKFLAVANSLYFEMALVQPGAMTDSATQTDINETFSAAERTGLKLAIKGRTIAVLLVGAGLAATRNEEGAFGYVMAILVFAGLGILHYLIIGSARDRNWIKYVFLSIDILLLSMAVAVVPPSPGIDLPQVFMYRFNIFPFYFIILGIAAFSFSPGLVLWAGLLGASGWIAAFARTASQMESFVSWIDIPADPTREQFLAVFMDEKFASLGSRLQEALIYLVVAILIAVVMHRARQTVRRQLEAERDMTAVSQMFGRFVPKAVADSMIKDKGALDPVERQATVLFTDLAGFTSLTEARGPRAIVDILNAYFDEATEIIGKHNGVVTQFQGDAILAIFNVPFEDPDHAQHAYDASIELIDMVAKKTFAGEKLSLRVGLNSGPLIAGNVGGGGRQTYTVHGDTVNLAARLEALNKDYGTSLLVSQMTVDQLINSALEKIGEAEIRGLSEPVGLFALEGSRVSHKRPIP
jgi:adenylate cyclase